MFSSGTLLGVFLQDAATSRTLSLHPPTRQHLRASQLFARRIVHDRRLRGCVRLNEPISIASGRQQMQSHMMMGASQPLRSQGQQSGGLFGSNAGSSLTLSSSSSSGAPLPSRFSKDSRNRHSFDSNDDFTCEFVLLHTEVYVVVVVAGNHHASSVLSTSTKPLQLLHIVERLLLTGKSSSSSDVENAISIPLLFSTRKSTLRALRLLGIRESRRERQRGAPRWIVAGRRSDGEVLRVGFGEVLFGLGQVVRRSESNWTEKGKKGGSVMMMRKELKIGVSHRLKVAEVEQRRREEGGRAYFATVADAVGGGAPSKRSGSQRKSQGRRNKNRLMNDVHYLHDVLGPSMILDAMFSSETNTPSPPGGGRIFEDDDRRRKKGERRRRRRSHHHHSVVVDEDEGEYSDDDYDDDDDFDDGDEENEDENMISSTSSFVTPTLRRSRVGIRTFGMTPPSFVSSSSSSSSSMLNKLGIEEDREEEEEEEEEEEGETKLEQRQQRRFRQKRQQQQQQQRITPQIDVRAIRRLQGSLRPSISPLRFEFGLRRKGKRDQRQRRDQRKEGEEKEEHMEEGERRNKRKTVVKTTTTTSPTTTTLAVSSTSTSASSDAAAVPPPLSISPRVPRLQNFKAIEFSEEAEEEVQYDLNQRISCPGTPSHSDEEDSDESDRQQQQQRTFSPVIRSEAPRKLDLMVCVKEEIDALYVGEELQRYRLVGVIDVRYPADGDREAAAAGGLPDPVEFPLHLDHVTRLGKYQGNVHCCEETNHGERRWSFDCTIPRSTLLNTESVSLLKYFLGSEKARPVPILAVPMVKTNGPVLSLVLTIKVHPRFAKALSAQLMIVPLRPDGPRILQERHLPEDWGTFDAEKRRILFRVPPVSEGEEEGSSEGIERKLHMQFRTDAADLDVAEVRRDCSVYVKFLCRGVLGVSDVFSQVRIGESEELFVRRANAVEFCLVSGKFQVRLPAEEE